MKYHTADKTRIFLICALIMVCLHLTAQIPARPNPQRLVNDFTNTLSQTEINALESMLVNYNDTTSTQFTVVLVNDLQGYDIAQYATELGHAWGVGQGAKDNGAVILVKPKDPHSKGEVNISVGYGLEPFITDAASHAIIQNEMIPEFMNGNYYQGIHNAIQVMMGLCSGKFTADEYAGDNAPLIILAFFLLIAAILTLRGFSKSQTYSNRGVGDSLLDAILWGMIHSSGSGNHHSSSSSGGFGGFGGGHFGGGGASGSW